jgi:hypothetical protein
MPSRSASGAGQPRRAVLGRDPSLEERRQVRDWLAGESAGEAQPAAVWQRLAHAVLATAEFQFVD